MGPVDAGGHGSNQWAMALGRIASAVTKLPHRIRSLEDANAMLSALEAEDMLGIALDTYALWWDWQLESQIQACGPRILHLHVSDWLPRTRDLRLDRGMPGDGCIDNRNNDQTRSKLSSLKRTAAVAQAGT